MDRSSFNRVENTKDAEKRLAFKAKLASKINSPKLRDLSVEDNTFNGVSPGGVLFHPSLGEGTLVEVDHGNNEVIIDFASKGLIGLVLSQAKSFVHAPLKPEAEIKEDPFLGSEIQSRLLAPQDRDFREVDFSKIVSPDFVDFEKSFLPVGSQIAHPSLGNGILVEVDKKKNEVAIDFGDRGIITLVLSQIKSFLSVPQKEIKVIEDPFVGDKIQRDGPIKPDSAQRVLDTSKVVSSDFVESKIPFLEPGTKVLHQDLGECTIVSLDKVSNEIVLENNSGLANLVLSQVRSKITPVDVVRKESKSHDDPFIGDKIQRDGPIKPDSAQRVLDTSKVVSSDFVESKIPFLEPGTKVLHQDLGECTIVSLDKASNEIVLENNSGLANLVLSQVRSKITPVDVVRKEFKSHDDPFFGDKIQRDGPIKPDSVQRVLDTTKIVSPDFADSEISFLEPGTKVLHKDLGECIIVFLNKPSNEIVLDSNSHGFINLVLSQVRSKIIPVDAVRKEAKVIEDPFLGAEIQRDGPVKPDSVQRSLDTTKIVSPDFVDSEKSFISIGKSVWHPDLGVCTVVSIDEKNNNLTLSTSSNDVIDMVLSQVRSKLGAIDTAPEHVPTKPLIREQLAKQVPQYTSRGDVSVRLPEAFKSWQRNQQFMFLTRSQSLTTEQANDVFAVLNGNKPMFHNVAVAWQSQKETEANIIPTLKTSTLVNEVKVFPNILENKYLWHPDFGECTVASVDEKNNQLILQTSVGQVPCVMDATLPSLAVLTSDVKHAPKKLGTKDPVPAVAKPVQPRVTLLLPNEFNSWKKLEQYQYLTGNKHLIPEDANAFLAGSADKYKIQWTKSPPEANKRAEFKQQLLDRVKKATVEPKVPISPAFVDSGTKRFFEKKIVTKKNSINKVSVDLPTDFKNWTSSGQYVFLTRSRQLTFDEANDLMDTLQDKPLISPTQYEIIWRGIDPVAYADSGVRRTTEEIDVSEKKSVLKKIVIKLPIDFKNWSASKQYSFLTRARELTIDESNGVLNTLQSKPFNSNVEYEIAWSD